MAGKLKHINSNSATWRAAVRRKLSQWFIRFARDLPWRKTRDWYPVWISEIMLQQTQVATVIPYFHRFVSRFPTVHSLASADEQDVLRLWEGLGYYRRARQLHAAARVIVANHRGQFPNDSRLAQSLPGIGRYTAGAVLSIAYDQREPILEANTVRVLGRLLAFPGDPHSKAGQATLWSFAEDLLPAKNVGQCNQALMELGSQICTPRNPACPKCPVAMLCPTKKYGLQESIPAPKMKKKFVEVSHAIVVVKRGQRVLVRQCGDSERWSGLWDFPRFELDTSQLDIQSQLHRRVQSLTGIRIERSEHLETLRHGVTRYRITLECFLANPSRGRLKTGARWISIEDLADYPLNTTGRKIAVLVRDLVDGRG